MPSPRPWKMMDQSQRLIARGRQVEFAYEKQEALSGPAVGLDGPRSTVPPCLCSWDRSCARLPFLRSTAVQSQEHRQGGTGTAPTGADREGAGRQVEFAYEKQEASAEDERVQVFLPPDS